MEYFSAKYKKNYLKEACCISRLILGLHPGNEWRHYKLTPSLIGWAQT